MPSPLLEAAGLKAGYGDSTVLDGLSVHIDEGSITAIVGSNGVGKTTLMRVLSGLIAPSAGEIRFAGTPMTRDTAAQRVERGLSLVPEGRLVFPDLTVQETLHIGAFLPRVWRHRHRLTEEMFTLFPRLAERRRQRAGSLSGGEQQMLALGRALMSRPRLLLLDEPSLGLAPVMVAYLFEAIETIRKSGVTICLVEQDVHAALEIADHAYVIEHGTVVNEGTGRDLLASPEIRASFLGI